MSDTFSWVSKPRSVLLASGYVRELTMSTTAKLFVPVEIVHIVVEFYFQLFQWNFNVGEIGDGWELMDENNQLTVKYTTPTDRWSVIYLKNVISMPDKKTANNSRHSPEFEWEIRIDGEAKNLWMMLGFVSADIPMEAIKQNRNNYPHKGWSSVKKFQPCAVGFANSHHDCFYLHGTNGEGTKVLAADNHNVFTVDAETSWQTGDTFGLRFNFVDHTCALYYNGEFVNIIYRDVPSKVKLFLAPFQSQTFTVTKYNWRVDC